MVELKPSPQEAVEFLEWFQPGAPWAITHATPGWEDVRTDWPCSPAAVRAFVAGHRERGLFYTVARVQPGVDRKPKKQQLLDISHLQLDLDPPDGVDPSDFDGWRKEALEGIRSRPRVPHPSYIGCSGSGLHLLWKLTGKPFPLGGEAQVEAIECYNAGLLDAFGRTDGTWNVDRLLRLPGSVNWPSPKKLRGGRKPSSAYIVELNERVYDLSDFMPTASHPAARSSGNAARKAGGGERGQLRRLGHPDELDQWDVSLRMRAVIVQGTDPVDPDRYPSRSEALFAVCRGLVECGVPDELTVGIITDPAWPISGHVLDQKRSTEYAWDQVAKARDKAAEAELDTDGRRVLNPAAPYKIAQRLRAELLPTAIHTNGDWLEYRLGAYRDVEDATIKRDLYAALDASVVRKKTNDKVEFLPFNPDAASVSRVLDALRGVAHQPADRMAPPVWMDGDGPPPVEVISCRNGLLHVPSGELLEPTPRFFTRNALDIDYAPDAPQPGEWLDFVQQVFPEPAAAELLQDWFGYLLLPDTSQEKMLLIVGPPRSGKGTIQKVLTELIGRSNVCAPSIKSLGGDFGLQPLIGKQVAFLSDIRIGRGADAEAITETLLRITGQDDVTANRKHKEAWTGRLAVRFVVSSNELPGLRDNSPALANRFVPLLMERSFLGQEDHGLAARLVRELPGILNWAIDGWRRLRERGHFALPDVSRAAINEIQEIGSPVAAFIRDRCVLDPVKSVSKEALYAAYRGWCEASGAHAVRDNVFARDLRTATAQAVQATKLSVQGGRVPAFSGIALLGGNFEPGGAADMYERGGYEREPY
jgi:P4 family phage/plasmid primase-like protien